MYVCTYTACVYACARAYIFVRSKFELHVGAITHFHRARTQQHNPTFSPGTYTTTQSNIFTGHEHNTIQHFHRARTQQHNPTFSPIPIHGFLENDLNANTKSIFSPIPNHSLLENDLNVNTKSTFNHSQCLTDATPHLSDISGLANAK